MRVVIGSDAEGMSLKNIIKETLVEDGHEVVDLSEEPAADFVDSALAVAQDVKANEGSLGFCFDGFGVGSYMVCTRVKGMVCANISDERSAYMTREHNNSRIVCMGPNVVGPEVAKKIAREFLAADYAAGRHQVRVDMLDKMA
ncbi:galactose-6-phosphate isomerase subunit LacA [Paratractidigestivibacter sp.]|uniref:galactose-6-phosphate isomerase subunit LacA n=1 Tax=Paratractidigestivibacter sp. TaxID=2847316 RepID=UPI002ABE4C0B|nr:galactose-6-phosphate isomerase subunit LacA [Paratractidigestivibacter sp.]